MTTKIQFKLSNDVLLTVIQMVEKTDDYIVRSIKDALLVSIKEDLIAKLEDKAKNIQKQISILDHNKKHAIVLKYHEAYTMYKLLELVYEKETFADHPHIKKIKRLLVDLENKVESFTTENEAIETTQTATPVVPAFPSLGVNEIIIEEATILDYEGNEELQADPLEEEEDPILDPTVDVNEIMVKNYSIFDILEETDPATLPIEEPHSLSIEVVAAETVIDPVPPQSNEYNTFEAETRSTEAANTPGEEKPMEEVETAPIQEGFLAEEEVTAAQLTQIPAEEILLATDEDVALEEPTPTIEPTHQQEESVPSWAQQPSTPIFDGIVTKTSICIEPEDGVITSPIELEEEETLDLFEGEILSIPSQEEKVEKEGKKEKKKPAKDNSQQGQISLF